MSSASTHSASTIGVSNTAAKNRTPRNLRRAARADRRALRAELAGFVTPADRLEIELIAGRYSDEDSREVREILLRRDVGV